MKSFNSIKYWIFDLDNTLYSGKTKVFDQVNKRMSKYVSEKLGVTINEAKIIQKKWDSNFTNKIEFVFGDEWHAGNLSYHLDSRPKWIYWDFKSDLPLPKWKSLKISYIQIGDWVTKSNCWNGIFFKIESLNTVCIVDNK